MERSSFSGKISKEVLYVQVHVFVRLEKLLLNRMTPMSMISSTMDVVGYVLTQAPVAGQNRVRVAAASLFRYFQVVTLRTSSF